jgi:splicing factor U2AF subunit
MTGEKIQKRDDEGRDGGRGDGRGGGRDGARGYSGGRDGARGDGRDGARGYSGGRDGGRDGARGYSDGRDGARGYVQRYDRENDGYSARNDRHRDPRDDRRDYRERDFDRRNDRRDDYRQDNYRNDRTDHRNFDKRPRPYSDRGQGRDFNRSERRFDRGPRVDTSKLRHQPKIYSPPPPDCVPLHMRPRKLALWDVAPRGYENVTPMEAKATGAFLLPSHLLKGLANPQQATIAAAAFGNAPPPLMLEGLLGPSTQLNRQQRRIYVGNLPPNVSEDSISDFISNAFFKLEIPGTEANAVVSTHLNTEKNFAYCEFKTNEEATEAMQLHGLKWDDHVLTVLRPRDYNSQDSQLVLAGVGDVKESPFKIFVGGIPPYLSEENIRDLLEAFGELRTFKLIKDPVTTLSKGFAICEYANPDVTDVACEGLHGLELGDNRLIMQRAATMAAQLTGGAMPIANPILPIEILGGASLKQSRPTKILLLLNMVTEEELGSDSIFEGIL